MLKLVGYKNARNKCVRIVARDKTVASAHRTYTILETADKIYYAVASLKLVKIRKPPTRVTAAARDSSESIYEIRLVPINSAPSLRAFPCSSRVQTHYF